MSITNTQCFLCCVMLMLMQCDCVNHYNTMWFVMCRKKLCQNMIFDFSSCLETWHSSDDICIIFTRTTKYSREQQNIHANNKIFTRTTNHSREPQTIHANHIMFARTINHSPSCLEIWHSSDDNYFETRKKSSI